MAAILSVCSVLSLVTLGLAVDLSTPLGKMTLFQLRGEMVNFIQEHRHMICNYSQELMLDKMCVDDRKASDCSLVVENHLCDKELFYARYCCRSCTLARQIPTLGDHLNSTAEAPITVFLVSESDNYLEGSDITLSCTTSGFPPPEIVWFWQDDNIRYHGIEYEEKITELGGLFTKEIRSDLIVRNVTGNNSVNVMCMAINRVDKRIHETILSLKPVVSRLHPEVPIIQLSGPKVLEFVVNGSRASEIQFSIPEVNYTTSESESFEDGVKTITYRITLQNPTVGKYRFKYDDVNYEGRLYESSRDIYVVPDSEVPDGCIDVVPSTECIDSHVLCDKRAIAHYCCKTCTLFTNTSFGSPFPPWSSLYVSLQTPWGNIPYGSKQQLHCDANSIYGNITFTWFKDNQKIQNSHRYFIEESHKMEGLSWDATSSLTISEVEILDAGTYTCQLTIDDQSVKYSEKLVFLKEGVAKFEYVYA